MIADEINRTRFLAPEKNNRLILFSDHGNRRELNANNFGKPVYHRVVLATFSIPPTSNLKKPISLLDISSMIGILDPTTPLGPADPVVQFALTTKAEWSTMAHTTKIHLDGEISLDSTILTAIKERLKGFRPYSNQNFYFSIENTRE